MSYRKRFLVGLLSALFCLCGVFGFASCEAISGLVDKIKGTETEHTFGEWTVTTPATCTTDGEETRSCDCGEKETRPIAALGHTFGEWTVTTPATCTTDGEETRSCDCGEKETQPIAALGHAFGEWTVTTPATCTEKGEKTRTCINCQEEKETEELLPLGHKYGAWTTAQEPTCTEDGREQRVCEHDATHVETRTVGKLQHNYVTYSPVDEVNHKKSCGCGDFITETHNWDSGVAVTEGTKYTCQDCGYENIKISDPVDTHDLSYFAEVAATCTAAGNVEYWHCNDCDKYFSDEAATTEITLEDTVIAALAHKNASVDTTDADCSAEGKKEYACPDCGATWTEILQKTDHVWNDGAVQAATCEHGGYTVYTCTVCYETKQENPTEATGHIWVVDEANSTAPTCDTKGTTRSVCSTCSAAKDEDVEALGHDYADTVVAPTCLTDGYTKHTCQRTDCGHTYNTDIVRCAGQHSWETTNTVEATCTTNGSITKECSECDATATEVINATGHITVSATCETAAYCSVCGEEIGAALGHAYSVTADVAATCTEDGYISYACTNGCCDKTYTDVPESYKATGHNESGVEEWNYETVAAVTVLTATAENCLYQEKKTGVCPDCGETVEIYSEPFAKHSYVCAITTAPTCQTSGVKTYTCSVCSDAYTEEYSDASAHVWDNGVAQTSGVTLYSCTCEGCDATKTTLSATSETTATVPPDVLSEAGEIALQNATITLDEATKEQLAGAEVNVGAEKLGLDDLSDEVRNGLSEEDAARIGEVFNLTLGVGENNVSSFNGKVKVRVPYTLEADEDPEDIIIAYINDAGAIELIEATYVIENDVGYAEFETSHFSYYTVTKMTPKERCAKYGHNNVHSVKPATCLTGGYEVDICARCGKKEYTNKTDALGHDWVVDQTTLVEATCVIDGYAKTACSRCDVGFETVTPAYGHTWTKDETQSFAATCTSTGLEVYVCACTSSYNVELAMTAHDYERVTTDPTCTEAGYTTYTCNGCDHSYIDDYVVANGHTETVTVVDPTCTTKGYTITTCSVCEEVLSITDETDYAEHDWDRDEPDCEHGQKCKHCHKHGKPAKGHSMKNNGRCEHCQKECEHEREKTGHVEATCTKVGYDVYTCKYCHHTEKRNETKGDHKYEKVGEVGATCGQDGYDILECKDCHSSKHEKHNNGQRPDHNYIVKEKVEPTCTKGGYTVYICRGCKAEKTDDYTDALGHTFEDGYCKDCGLSSDRFYFTMLDTLENVSGVQMKLENFELDMGANGIDVEGNTFFTSTVTIKQIDVTEIMLGIEEGELYGAGIGTMNVNTPYMKNVNVSFKAIIEDNVLYIVVDGLMETSYVTLDLDMLMEMLREAADTSEEGVEMLVAWVNDDLMPLFSGYIDENAAEIDGIIQSVVSAFFTTTSTEEGIEIALDYEKVISVNEDLANLSITEWVEKYFGEGKVAELEEEVSALLDVKVSEILDYADEKGLDKDMLVSTINNFVEMMNSGELNFGFNFGAEPMPDSSSSYYPDYDINSSYYPDYDMGDSYDSDFTTPYGLRASAEVDEDAGEESFDIASFLNDCEYADMTLAEVLAMLISEEAEEEVTAEQIFEVKEQVFDKLSEISFYQLILGYEGEEGAEEILSAKDSVNEAIEQIAEIFSLTIVTDGDGVIEEFVFSLNGFVYADGSDELHLDFDFTVIMNGVLDVDLSEVIEDSKELQKYPTTDYVDSEEEIRFVKDEDGNVVEIVEVYNKNYKQYESDEGFEYNGVIYNIVARDGYECCNVLKTDDIYGWNINTDCDGYYMYNIAGFGQQVRNYYMIAYLYDTTTGELVYTLYADENQNISETPCVYRQEIYYDGEEVSLYYYYNPTTGAISKNSVHNWVLNQDKSYEPADCSEKGCRYYECSFCGQVNEEYYSYGHSYEGEYTMEDGQIVYKETCSVCGATRVSQDGNFVFSVDEDIQLSLSEENYNGYLTLVFVPAKSGVYEFYSTDGENDPYGYILDQYWNHLKSNDDYEGLEFYMTYNFIAGETYYLAVGRGYSSCTVNLHAMKEISSIDLSQYSSCGASFTVLESSRGEKSVSVVSNCKFYYDYIPNHGWGYVCGNCGFVYIERNECVGDENCDEIYIRSFKFMNYANVEDYVEHILESAPTGNKHHNTIWASDSVTEEYTEDGATYRVETNTETYTCETCGVVTQQTSNSWTYNEAGQTVKRVNKEFYASEKTGVLVQTYQYERTYMHVTLSDGSTRQLSLMTKRTYFDENGEVSSWEQREYAYADGNYCYATITYTYSDREAHTEEYEDHLRTTYDYRLSEGSETCDNGVDVYEVCLGCGKEWYQYNTTGHQYQYAYEQNGNTVTRVYACAICEERSADAETYEYILSLGDNVTLSLFDNPNSNYLTFVFVPAESGKYDFYSTDYEGDPYGYIYDSEWNCLASDDDSGYDWNFSISYEFEAGKTYYLAIGRENTSCTIHLYALEVVSTLDLAEYGCACGGDITVYENGAGVQSYEINVDCEKIEHQYVETWGRYANVCMECGFAYQHYNSWTESNDACQQIYVVKYYLGNVDSEPTEYEVRYLTGKENHNTYGDSSVETFEEVIDGETYTKRVETQNYTCQTCGEIITKYVYTNTYNAENKQVGFARKTYRRNSATDELWQVEDLEETYGYAISEKGDTVQYILSYKNVNFADGLETGWTMRTYSYENGYCNPTIVATDNNGNENSYTNENHLQTGYEYRLHEGATSCDEGLDRYQVCYFCDYEYLNWEYASYGHRYEYIYTQDGNVVTGTQACCVCEAEGDGETFTYTLTFGDNVAWTLRANYNNNLTFAFVPAESGKYGFTFENTDRYIHAYVYNSAWDHLYSIYGYTSFEYRDFNAGETYYITIPQCNTEISFYMLEEVAKLDFADYGCNCGSAFVVYERLDGMRFAEYINDNYIYQYVEAWGHYAYVCADCDGFAYVCWNDYTESTEDCKELRKLFFRVGNINEAYTEVEFTYLTGYESHNSYSSSSETETTYTDEDGNVYTITTYTNTHICNVCDKETYKAVTERWYDEDGNEVRYLRDRYEYSVKLQSIYKSYTYEYRYGYYVGGDGYTYSYTILEKTTYYNEDGEETSWSKVEYTYGSNYCHYTRRETNSNGYEYSYETTSHSTSWKDIPDECLTETVTDENGNTLTKVTLSQELYCGRCLASLEKQVHITMTDENGNTVYEETQYYESYANSEEDFGYRIDRKTIQEFGVYEYWKERYLTYSTYHKEISYNDDGTESYWSETVYTYADDNYCDYTETYTDSNGENGQNEYEDQHLYTKSAYRLHEGNTSCEQGLDRYTLCLVCGDEYNVYENWTYGHEREAYPEFIEGGLCGGYIELYDCPCGERVWVNTDYLNCDLGYNYEYDYDGEETRYDYYKRNYGCAVSHPEACGFTYTYEYWYTLDEACREIDHVRYVFGDKVVERSYHNGNYRHNLYGDWTTTETVEDGLNVKIETMHQECIRCGLPSDHDVYKYYYDGDGNVTNYTIDGQHYGWERSDLSQLKSSNHEEHVYYTSAKTGHRGERLILQKITDYSDGVVSGWTQYVYTYTDDNYCAYTCETTYSTGSGAPYSDNFHSIDWNNSEWIQERTCEQNGILGYRCLWCEEYAYKDTYYAYGHSYSLTDWVIEPTCTQWGVGVWTCWRDGCTASYQNDHSPYGHNYSYDYDTCLYTCTRCELQNFTGYDGSIWMEDLTGHERYGEDGKYVVGYYEYNSFDYVIVLELIVEGLEESIIIYNSDPDLADLYNFSITDDGNSFVYISVSDIEAAAEAEGYTDGYMLRVSFVPTDSEHDLDYAITLDRVISSANA